MAGIQSSCLNKELPTNQHAHPIASILTERTHTMQKEGKKSNVNLSADKKRVSAEIGDKSMSIGVLNTRLLTELRLTKSEI